MNSNDYVHCSSSFPERVIVLTQSVTVFVVSQPYLSKVCCVALGLDLIHASVTMQHTYPESIFSCQCQQLQMSTPLACLPNLPHMLRQRIFREPRKVIRVALDPVCRSIP